MQSHRPAVCFQCPPPSELRWNCLHSHVYGSHARDPIKHSQFNDASSRQVFLPIFASLADVFGRHSAMQFALCCFLVGSALSTGAQNMAMMLAGRAIAGVGAAGLITVRYCSITAPNSRLMTPYSIWQLIRTILADTRSLRAQNIQATCLFVLYGLGFSTGPVIGGSLSKLSLRWIFGIKYVVIST